MLPLVWLPFVLFFRLPLLIQAALVGLLVWGGFVLRDVEGEHQAQIAALSQRPPPEVVDISAFDRSRIGQEVVEAQIRARWAYAFNTKLLTDRTTGDDRHDSSYIVLLDETPAAGDRHVAAVVSVPGGDHDRLVEWLQSRIVDDSADLPVVVLEGFAERLSSMPNASRTRSSLAERHLIVDDRTFALEPFVLGRDAALHARPKLPNEMAWVIWYMAMALGAACGLRFAWRLATGKIQQTMPSLQTAVPIAVGVGLLVRLTGSEQALVWVPGLVLIGGLGLGYVLWRRARPVAEAAPEPDARAQPLPAWAVVKKPTEAPPSVPTAPHPTLADLRAPQRKAGPIQTTPTTKEAVQGLWSNKRFLSWAPFLLGLAVILGGAWIDNGVEGVKAFLTLQMPMRSIPTPDPQPLSVVPGVEGPGLPLGPILKGLGLTLGSGVVLTLAF